MRVAARRSIGGAASVTSSACGAGNSGSVRSFSAASSGSSFGFSGSFGLVAADHVRARTVPASSSKRDDLASPRS